MKNIKFNVKEFIEELFNKEYIDFDYYHDEDRTHVSMNLSWNESDKNDLIDKFNLYFDEINVLNVIDDSKSKELFNKYFKFLNKNKYFEDLSVLGARVNSLIVNNTPDIILVNEFKTTINLVLLNHYATKAHITKEISEFVVFDNNK